VAAAETLVVERLMAAFDEELKAEEAVGNEDEPPALGPLSELRFDVVAEPSAPPPPVVKDDPAATAAAGVAAAAVVVVVDVLDAAAPPPPADEAVLVESEMIILPWTGRPSFDFLRSRVSISNVSERTGGGRKKEMGRKGEWPERREGRQLSPSAHVHAFPFLPHSHGQTARTMSSAIEIEHVRHLDIDDAKEALVALFELAMVEDLA
jgi:hypothetical protein